MTWTTLRMSGLGAAAILAGAVGAAVAADKPAAVMKPVHGVSFDVGRSHAVSYFTAESGVCNLTMVVADILTDDVLPVSAGTRFNVAIAGGKTARIDTAEGKSVEFTCAAGAKSVSLRKLDTVAHTASRTN
ncbi:MAG: hypothetical protein ACT4N2_02755 [Hyphomicrobium sp.]